jgi:hypothetical protein
MPHDRNVMRYQKIRAHAYRAGMRTVNGFECLVGSRSMRPNAVRDIFIFIVVSRLSRAAPALEKREAPIRVFALPG